MSVNPVTMTAAHSLRLTITVTVNVFISDTRNSSVSTRHRNRCVLLVEQSTELIGTTIAQTPLSSLRAVPRRQIAVFRLLWLPDRERRRPVVGSSMVDSQTEKIALDIENPGVANERLICPRG
jgi:hypothetical protein